jgi:nucleotide-binding universal stress UspA family protein
MTILAATDFSPCSLTAVRLAAAMARRRGGSLVLVHSIEPLPVDPIAMPLGGQWEAAIVTSAEQALAIQVDDLRKSGLTVKAQVQFGSPAGNILEAARETKPELIVLGTHGRQGTARLFLGSCAETVVRSSACPVLVTGADATGLERWNGSEPLRLAVATDGSHACEAAYFWIRTSGLTTADDLSLVRVYWPPQEAAHYGLEEPWLGHEGHPDLVRLLERDLRRDAQALMGASEPRVRFQVAWHNAGEALSSDVRQLGADAIVVGVPAHRRGTLVGLSPASLLRSAHVPVFCIPESAAPKQRHIPKIHSVLIAFDLSETSRAGILPGYGLLLGGGRAELCYVHVHGAGDALADLTVNSRMTVDERATLEARLRAETPPEAAEHGISTHVSVVEGSFAAEAILQAAERLDVDVIAMGSHGRTGVKRTVLGSVAEEVARRSSRPVFIVRAQPDETRVEATR